MNGREWLEASYHREPPQESRKRLSSEIARLPEFDCKYAGLAERYARVMVEMGVGEWTVPIAEIQELLRQERQYEQAAAAYRSGVLKAEPAPSEPMTRSQYSHYDDPSPSCLDALRSRYSTGLCHRGAPIGQYSIDDHPLSHTGSWDDHVGRYEDCQ